MSLPGMLLDRNFVLSQNTGMSDPYYFHRYHDGYRVEDHERDLIRVQRLSLRTYNDQGSHTKERDRTDGGEGTRAMELIMTRTR
jgi:hypothetical protein